MTKNDSISRRDLLAAAAFTAGASILPPLQGTPAAPQTPQTPAQTVPADPDAAPGAPTSAQSVRSALENPARTPTGILTGSSFTPLQHLTGSVTPNDLLVERHHSGVPAIDPAKHKLLIHKLVERPKTFTLDDLKRFPSVSRVHFLECS